MTYLSIWSGGIGQGHAGIQVGNEYITWIPDTANCHLDYNNPKSYQTQFPREAGITFKEDLRRNGGMPDYYYSYQGLDEKAMLQWWQKWKYDPSLKWNYKESSCMTVVAMALNAGLGKDYPQLQMPEPQKSVITWLQMKVFAENILKITG